MLGQGFESPGSPTLNTMAKVDKLGSARRFGARYGTKPKHKFAKIEKEQRKKHKCPYCNYVQVKRVALGIWQCRKCDAKFTGRAYTIGKPTIVPIEKEPEAQDSENIEEETDSEEDIEENDDAEEAEEKKTEESNDIEEEKSEEGA